MKNLIFIMSILIILFKTGNVLSNSNIFNVNNIELDETIYKNKENLINQAFKKGFNQLINRLLLEVDLKRLSSTSLDQIKNLISYYQIVEPNNKERKDNKINVNIFFDKDKIHDFFYQRNILYSDIVNTEIILLPLLIKDKKYFIYSQNFFYENWSQKSLNDLIQYDLPVENIEIIQLIKKNINNIYSINLSNFFEEYNSKNMAFIIIEIENNIAKVFLNTKIEGKKINKTISIKQQNLNQIDFYQKIIFDIKNILRDLIKSQNLIDVRIPSFLNVEIRLNNKSNLVELKNRIQNIDLIDEFYIQQLNKDYALVKIKFLGKINKIIKELKDENIDLIMKNGEWKLNII